MKIHDPRFVDRAYVSLVESQIGDLAPLDDITIGYVVAEQFSQREIDTWKLLIESERSGMNRLFAIEKLSELIAVMSPFVGKPILRAAFWKRDTYCDVYIDQTTGQTIHRSPNT